MANAHGGTAEIKNPGPFEISGNLKGLFVTLVLIGILSFAFLLFKEPVRAWSTYVMSYFYFISLALGGLFFAAIQWLTSAMWSAPLRRVGESFTSFLPVGLVLLVGLFFGVGTLYHWSHPDMVQGDAILSGKSGYLNTPFFIIRNVIAVAIWIFFARKMIGNSLAQDVSKDAGLTQKNKVFAPIFLILFAISYTVSSFDQLMSIDAHWFSTMYGVYCFAGLFYTTLALITVVTVLLKRQGKLEGIINDNHLHDMGKFMFAFTVFWAYIAFSQFMLIWYANLPEETGFYIKRMEGQWLLVTIALLVGKFIVPFFMLLTRGAKRSESNLLRVGIWMLLMHWIDLIWLVQPELYPDGPRVGFLEVGIALGFLGVFALTVSRFFARHNVVAIGDPRLAESVHHHHQ